MDLGMGEILLILLVALLMYGGRLPEVARSLGRSLGALKRGLEETKDLVKIDLDEPPPRVVRRRAPEELAKEDVSPPALPTASPPSAPSPPHAPAAPPPPPAAGP